MKLTIVWLLLAFLSIATILSCKSVQSSNLAKGPATNIERKTECLTQGDFANALRTLSTGNWPEVEHAQQQLLNVAAESESCRAEVISVLMKAMDQPNLNFRDDPASLQLWRWGAEVLGDLKATEALDLLISHLNLTGWTFSMSMSHQPALGGVIKIGPAAIPKLDQILKHSSDPTMRHSAVYCIATIGGLSAVTSLEESLRSESDRCVRRFIKASLDSFDENGQIKNRGEWFSGFACND